MEEFDVLIVSHKKDFDKLPFCIKSIRQYLNGYQDIHIISNEIIDIEGVICHYEQDVLKVDKTRIKHKPSWIYQQMLKLLQTVTRKWYLVIDADTYLNKPLEVFENGKPIIFNGIYPVSHDGYFLFSEKYFNVSRVYPETFVCEIMLFNQDIVNEMFESNGYLTTQDKVNLFYNAIDSEHFISEFELYGNYVEKTRPELYIKITIYGRHWLGIEENYWNDKTIQEFIDKNPDSDIISTHSMNHNNFL